MLTSNFRAPNFFALFSERHACATKSWASFRCCGFMLDHLRAHPLALNPVHWHLTLVQLLLRLGIFAYIIIYVVSHPSCASSQSCSSCRALPQMILDKKYCKEVPITGNIRLSVRSPISDVRQQLSSLSPYCCSNVSDSTLCTVANDSLTPTRRPCWCVAFVSSLYFIYLPHRFRAVPRCFVASCGAGI